MKWTKETPTREGPYWQRSSAVVVPWVAWIGVRHGALVDAHRQPLTSSGYAGMEWSSEPIPLPEERAKPKKKAKE